MPRRGVHTSFLAVSGLALTALVAVTAATAPADAGTARSTAHTTSRTVTTGTATTMASRVVAAARSRQAHAAAARVTPAHQMAAARAASSAAQPASVSPASATPTAATSTVGTFVGLSPERLLDTRPGHSTYDGRYQRSGPIPAGGTISLAVGGRGGVPSTAQAVVVNLTEASATAPSYLTMFPAGSARPGTSSINFGGGTITAVQATIKLGTGGQLQIYNNAGMANAVLDVVGYYAGANNGVAGSVFNQQRPTRVLDTRSQGHLQGYYYLSLDLTLANTTAVALNVTVVHPATAGFVAVWPGDGNVPPSTSAVNFVAGQTVANMAITQTLTGSTGQPAFSVGNQSSGTIDVIVDIVGYYTPQTDGGGSIFVPIVPKRIVDTRHGLGIAHNLSAGQQANAATSSVGDSGTVALVANGTGITPSAPTYLTFFSADVTRPNASNLNLVPQDIRSNMVITGVGSESTRPLAVYNNAGTTGLVVDAVGYFENTQRASTLTLTSSAASSTYDGPLTFTATLGDATSTGFIAFGDFSNQSVLAIVPVANGKATFTTSALAPGSRPVIAGYSGDGTHLGVASNQVPETVAAPATTVATAFLNDPRHDGQDLGDTFTAGTMHQAWSTQVSTSSSATISYPLIAGGRVFVITTSPQTKLIALDAATGTQDWYTVLSSTYTWFGLTYDGGQVFVQNSDGTLTALNAATGHTNWTNSPGQYSFSAPPTAYDGVLYASGAGTGGTLFAMSELDGSVMWSAGVANGDVSSPAVDDTGVYEDYACDLSYGFDLDGTSRWSDSFGCEGGGGATSVLHGGYLYLDGSGYGSGAKILSAADGSSHGTFGGTLPPAFDNTSLYIPAGGTLDSIDPTGSPAHWSFAGDSTIATTPVTTNGIVFTGSNNGHLYGINSSTGAQVWTATAPGAIATDDGFGTHTGIAAADGMLVVPAGGYVTVYTSPAG